MRARYCAYAIGRVDFLIATTHPDGPQARADAKAWRAELIEYCQQTEFVGLAILGDTRSDDDTEATVTFTAELRQGGQEVGFTERSRFVRDANRWKYHSGEMLEPPGAGSKS